MGMITIKRFWFVAVLLVLLLVAGCNTQIVFEGSNNTLSEGHINKSSIVKRFDYENNVTCYHDDSGYAGGLSCFRGILK